jgi:glutamate 5-kinase
LRRHPPSTKLRRHRMTSDSPRKALLNAKRIVVKIGSRAIVHGDAPGEGRFKNIAAQVASLYADGRTVILVSSGAVAMGCQKLGRVGRPKLIPELQAMAAIGQPLLLQAYAEAFAAYGKQISQILITHAEVADRKRYLNVGHAMDAMIALGAVPIINENDTVSTEELQFGDNDQLAAMVAPLAGADVLVLLTDVEGLLDAGKQRISVVSDFDAIEKLIWPKDNALSLGGMASKVSAARRACQAGVPVVIGPAKDPDVLRKVMDGEDFGTLFLPAGAALASRKYWIAYTLKMRGTLVVDDGARRALREHNRSLLPAGITEVRGTFRVDDAVSIVGLDGQELARGLSRYDARDVDKVKGVKSDQIEARLGFTNGDEIVHRDDLVVL